MHPCLRPHFQSTPLRGILQLFGVLGRGIVVSGGCHRHMEEPVSGHHTHHLPALRAHPDPDQSLKVHRLSAGDLWCSVTDGKQLWNRMGGSVSIVIYCTC